MTADPEKALAATVLVYPEALYAVGGVVSQADFISHEYAEVYGSAYSILDAGGTVTLATVADRLKRNGRKNAEETVVELSKFAESEPAAMTLAKVIRERSIIRNLKHFAGELTVKAAQSDADPFKLLSESEQRLMSIGDMSIATRPVPISEAIRDTVTHIEEIRAGTRKAMGVATGLIELDGILGGLHEGDLIVVGGRPGMGKSAFVLSIADYIGRTDAVGVFSLELSRHQVSVRYLAMHSGIAFMDLESGRFRQDQAGAFVSAAAASSSRRIWIDDTPGMKLMEVRAKVRRLVAQEHIRCAFIDRLELLDPPQSESRNQEISQLTRGLKALARELNIPVVLLVQLNRAVENRSDKRPMLSDLRDSGSIEQDAQVVLFPFRPEYYEFENYGDGSPTVGTAEIIIAKNTNGPTDTKRFSFVKERMRFDNLAPSIRESAA
jgi:replicative DNA helicase